MPEKGSVILVGAGPGDPGLLTLAGKAAIESADIVLYDRLVGPGVLALMPDAALRIDVGKNKGRHPVPQDEINRLIVGHAREGKTVVRLKGGDPYLFGRGAEELEAVARAGIPFRVVPGITSAIAAPAYAGIPVTHREYASSLHILTGHGRDGSPPDIPYRELAALKGTLVFLMGLSAVGNLCGGLIGAGMAADTPAALVENGTRTNQRRLTATLATLPGAAEERAFASPAVLIVGQVCSLAETFDWTVGLPLWGRRILVVSSRTTGGRLAANLRERGCGVDEFTGIRTEPLPAPAGFWNRLGDYGWIVLTSPVGVDCFFDGLAGHGVDIRTVAAARFAVVGSRTAHVLRERGVIADFVPEEYSGRALGEGLADIVRRDEKILLFRAEAGGGELPSVLRDHGLALDDHPAYRTIENPMPSAVLEGLRNGRYDAATFTSASSVEAFAAATTAGERAALRTFSIGDMTAAAAERHGMRSEAAPKATIESMAAMICERMGTR